MRLLSRSALCLLLAVICASGADAQDRAATERRLDEIRTQISGVEREVRQARSVETDALQAVERLGTEIRLREELVSGYRDQVAKTRRETESLQRSISRLEGEIDGAREAYRSRAHHAYMHGRRSPLALLLSSTSINQMLARARYLQQFAGRRRRQVERIGTKTDQLRAREVAVVSSYESTKRLLSESQREQGSLDARKRDHQGLIAQAREKRGQLEGQLRQRRADANALTQLVSDLRADERRRSEEARRVAAAQEAERRAEVVRQAEAVRIADAERRAAELSRRAMLADERRTSPERRNNTQTTAPPPAPVAVTPPTPAPAAASAAAPPLEDRAVALTGSFHRNLGQLPWPADGTVTGSFGTRTEPVYGTTTNSVGIDITTAEGAPARSVFEGTVERVGTMATFGTFVMVSHGDYTTVYGNLSQVVVRGGQTVRAGQVLGRAGTGEERRGSGLFFAVFNGGTPVNPVGWLRGR